MATKDDQETLRLLVQYVSRAFYEPKYTIIMDQLARHTVLKDDELAGRMGLQPKELNKVIAVLSNDSLVKVYRQNELKEGAQRSVGKQYYYIDYEHFCNVVKWRVAKMRHIIDETLRNTLDNKGYICPQCKQSYSPLDADKLMDFMRGAMFCEVCHAEVVDNEDAESVQGSKDRMQRFNNQMRFVREGLQKSEAMVLPHFDVAAWIKSNITEAEKNKASATGPGLKIAGTDSNGKEDEGVGIMLAMDKDEAVQRQERDAQAEIKRQQNALPSWHLKSTITGDLTALGIKESTREAAMPNGAQQVSNDDILKGLGIVGGGTLRGTAGQAAGRVGLISVSSQEDIKPAINVESDLYDQYYASLAAAASAASSGLPTPTTTAMGSSTAGSPNFPIFQSQLNDEDDDEDRKPNVEYLDSLNAYRKRSRSVEDVGPQSRTKVTRLNGNVYLGVNGYGYHNGITGNVESPAGSGGDEPPASQDTGMDSQSEGLLVEGLVDVAVFVAGVEKLYSRVTDEDHELMTPEEYTAYFEIFQARSEG